MVTHQNYSGNYSDDDFLRVTIEMISPEVAKNYLLTQESNRNINDRRAADYANRMRRGEWKVGQPISFDEDDRLIDGQHRLKAVIRYGKPVEFSVMRGVPSDSKEVFDIGQQRTTAQIAKLTERDKPQMSTRLAILSNAFFGSQFKGKTKAIESRRNAVNTIGATRGVRSPQAMLELEEKYSDGLDFAIRAFGSRDSKASVGNNSLIKAVFFRAFYNVDRDRLQQFMEVFYSGLCYSPGNEAAIKLREYVVKIRKGDIKVDAKHGGKAELYKKTESAIIYFLAKRNVSYLKGSEYEEFPLADFD